MSPKKEPNPQKEYFEKSKYFLDLLKNNEKIELLNNEKDIVEFVLNKLKVLAELNGILLEQIQTSLTNCGFLYDDNNKVILEFYDKILTYDLNEGKRNIYKEFVGILKKYDNKKISNSSLIRIFEIIRMANIKGIIISGDDLKTTQKRIHRN